MYLRYKNNTVEYPFQLRTIRLENPNISFPRELSPSLLLEYGVFPVSPTAQPEHTLTQDAIEQTPQLINGVWTQVWAMVDVSAEEVVNRQQQAADQKEQAAVKADTFVKNFIGMTPAQVETYVANNTANLTQVRALLTKIGIMLLLLAKREYR